MGTIVLDGATIDPTETETELIDLGDSIAVNLEEVEQTTVDLTGCTEPSLESLTDTSLAETINQQNVSVSGIENDSLLMYKTEQQAWVPSKYLENHTMEAGQY